MSYSRRAPLHKALIIALTSWGLVCITPEFARVARDDYATLGFEANNAGVVTSVYGSPAVDENIHRGDCIDLQRTFLPDRLAVFAGMGGMTYVRKDLKVTLEIRPEPCHLVRLPVSHTLTPKLSIPGSPNRLMILITGVLGVLSIILGAALVWQRPSAMTWGFFSYVLWFNPGQTFVFYAELQTYPYLFLTQEFLQAAAQAAGYAGFIAFALRFPRNVVDSRWLWLDRALPSVAAGFFLLSLATFGATLGYAAEGISRVASLVVYAVPVTVWMILHSRAKQQAPTDRQRTRWVDWACRIGLLPFIIADSNMTTSLWSPLVGPLCGSGSSFSLMACEHGRLSETTLLTLMALNAVVPAAIYHCVLTHRVIDVKFALSRGVTLLLTSVVLAWVFTETSLRIETKLKDSLQSRILVCTFLVIFIKLSFEYIHEKLNRACDLVFFRRLHSAEHEILVAGCHLHSAASLDEIDQHLMQAPLTSLRLASAAVFRRERGGAYRLKVDPVGWNGGRDACCPLEGELLKQLRGTDGALRLNESDGSKSPEADAVAPVLAIPVVAADVLVAVALYGAHRSGEDISMDEQRIIEALIEPARGAYASVEVATLRRRIDELDRELSE